MQIRLLVIIFSCLTFIILFVLIYNYTRATQTDLPNFAPYQLYSDSQSDTQIAEMSQWINKMSSQEQTPFVYPASMLNVKLIFEEDLSRDKHQEIFQVLVGKVDD
ncbi:MAG: hypothetical protein K2I63_00520, partial [Helicobacter sp.]|nr:hypothetical protein [Helicobacter sp.]